MFDLKEYAENGKDLGKWNGIRVKVCAFKDYDSKSKLFWVIYDMNSAVVKDGMIYGYMTRNGEVELVEKLIPLNWKEEEKEEEDMKKIHRGIDEICMKVFSFSEEIWNLED